MERKWGKKVHLVFKMRGPRELYLGPKDAPAPEKIKEALHYVEMMKNEYNQHYDELREKLLKLLPPSHGQHGPSTS